MTGSSSRLSIQVVDPRYGPGVDLAEREGAEVETGVETDAWSPRDPSPPAAGPLVFVDGAQRIEAWLSVSEDEGGEPVAGVCFAVAAGAVETTPGPGRARIVVTRIRRGVMAAGDRLLELPEVAGFVWEPFAGAAREPTGMHRRVGQFRQQIEHELAETLAGADRLVILDGRLSFLRDAHGPVVGAIKSHHVMYLAGEQAECVARLRVGQRTPLFAIGADRLSWYQRLPGAGERGWAGVMRGEVARAVGVRRAVELADRATAELPRFAGRPHRDPRAPQNLAPIAGLENRLTHMMGDRRLALRAIRRATPGARLDAAPAPGLQVDVPEAVAA